MKRRTKELALIAVACGLLVFEMVAIAGALPVVRRAMTRVPHTSVRVIEVNHVGKKIRTTQRSAVVTDAQACPIAKAVKQALL